MREATREEHARLREIWRSCRKRTMNPACKDYPKYGGRGIRMCPEWRDDYMEFERWALDNGYSNDLTLDRVSNNRGYSPTNCRWVSRRAQANNRTTASYYTVDGHRKTLARWCRIYDIPPHVVLHRIEDGWDVKRAITEPRRTRGEGRGDGESDPSDTQGE